MMNFYTKRINKYPTKSEIITNLCYLMIIQDKFYNIQQYFILSNKVKYLIISMIYYSININKKIKWLNDVHILTEKLKRKQIKNIIIILKKYTKSKKLRKIPTGIVFENKNDYYNYRLKNDIDFLLKHNLRSRFYNAMKRNSKKSSVLKLIGCSIEELKFYLSSKFEKNMNWDNYGKWEIDHIIPLTNNKNIIDINILWHYTNLQPLWKTKNRQKFNK